MHTDCLTLQEPEVDRDAFNDLSDLDTRFGFHPPPVPSVHPTTSALLEQPSAPSSSSDRLLAAASSFAQPQVRALFDMPLASSSSSARPPVPLFVDPPVLTTVPAPPATPVASKRSRPRLSSSFAEPFTRTPTSFVRSSSARREQTHIDESESSGGSDREHDDAFIDQRQDWEISDDEDDRNASQLLSGYNQLRGTYNSGIIS